MPDHAEPRPPSRRVAHNWVQRHGPSEQAFFSGTYGLVLSSALAAALDQPSQRSDPGADLLWVLLTALASAAAHGYAHVIARRTTAGRAGFARALRIMVAEWPLLVAALPALGFLLAAFADRLPESAAVRAALLFNTVALFCWGAWAARIAGRGWPGTLLSGSLDMVFGLVIIGANAVIK